MKIDFIHFESLPSTNTWAKENVSTFHPHHLTCITADEQTAGRGRQEKKWVSPKGANLYMTAYFTLPLHSHYLANIGQIMALACCKVLQDLHVTVELKWPNDILVRKQKIGGILTETITSNTHFGVFVGLGLNVNMPSSFLQAIDQPATSLHLFLSEPLAPSSLLKPLLGYFIEYLQELQAHGFKPFHPLFLDLLAYKGERITLQHGNRRIQGICETITPEGYLKLCLPSGDFLIVSAGEIS